MRNDCGRNVTRRAKSRPAHVSTTYTGDRPLTAAEEVFVRRGFLSPFAMLKVLGALERLSASWASSEDLGLLGRGQTGQIRVNGIAAQAQMDEVRHVKSFSMSFCLDCHRDPAAHIRPTDKVTNLGWQWSTNAAEAAEMQAANGKKFVHDWKVESLQSCSACHR